MPQRLVELLAGFGQEFHHTLFADLGTQCQRVDEHAGRIADAQIGAAVAEGGNAQLLVVGETRKCVEGSREGEVRRRDIVLTAELLYGFEIQLTRRGFDNALLFGVGQI